MHASTAGGGTSASGPAPAGDRDGGGVVESLLAVEARLASLIHARFDGLVESTGCLAALVSANVKGEIVACKSRQPSADALSDAASKEMCQAVECVIENNPQIRSADQMSKE